MLSATLIDGLKAYGIGVRMRALRLKKKMGLVEILKIPSYGAELLRDKREVDHHLRRRRSITGIRIRV